MENYLIHYGTKGQKWGVRKYQNEDGSYTAEGQAENNGHGRYSSLKEKLNSRIGKTLRDTYKLDEEEIEAYKSMAKFLGVSLAATAGVLAVSYALSNKSVLETISNFDLSDLNTKYGENLINRGEGIVHQVEGYNANSLLHTTTLVEDINNTALVGDPVGSLAKSNGFSICENGADLLSKAKDVLDYDSLAKNAIVNQRTPNFFSMDRRLSCWSGSHSYLLSMLTGKEYCSRNYQNLVEFNSFGSLYNSKMKIVDLFGNSASDFVGNWGIDKGSKVHAGDAYKIIDTIYNNFKTPNAKNGSIVGFIDAAYRKSSCSHQWNFEITSNGIMNIIDTWSGEKYEIARKTVSGSISYNMSNIISDKGNGASFLSELYHYNRESFRMYAPELDDLNLDAIANIVLAKTK